MADSIVERECVAAGLYDGLWCLAGWEENVSRELVELYRLERGGEEAS